MDRGGGGVGLKRGSFEQRFPGGEERVENLKTVKKGDEMKKPVGQVTVRNFSGALAIRIGGCEVCTHYRAQKFKNGAT